MAFCGYHGSKCTEDKDAIQKYLSTDSQGSCCGPGLWNIQYNPLLELNYTNRMKAIAFADDLILMTRGNTVREAENIANVEMAKISKWAKAN